ncbi:hypothetical protein H310_01877 [Aphanomyces invadans]|uniref:Uncharacterized protein n=1 Tax=Aphanomyces invadans TaxID=157072 RepID=A0A024UNY8_9STRA|nr:hypothetical protein H310_01877 [Aphanomyces invadans]ETW07338.1 hypothetical protein H310_01877 [Aphanomyces invadans]|eukprot:XP_008863431.1 hypothetical protein H310_01877 [Aphanomyces invadans]
MSHQDLAPFQVQPIQDPTHVLALPPAFECTPHDEPKYYPWLGVKAYETYINDSEFLFPNQWFSAPAEDIRETQRRHMYFTSTRTAPSPTPNPHPQAKTKLSQSSKLSCPSHPTSDTPLSEESDDEADMALSAEDCDARTIEHRIVIGSGASAHRSAADHLYAKATCNRQVIVTNGGATAANVMDKLNTSTSTQSTLTLTDVVLIMEQRCCC